jgi:cell division protein FtsA
MEDLDKIEVGLDIGTTKICVLAGKRNEFGKLEIIGMGKADSDGVEMGMVANIAKTVESIKKAVRECEQNAGIDIGEVNIGIAGHHIRSMKHHGIITKNGNDNMIEIEDVKRLNDEMYKIVMPPGDEIIHVMPIDYTIDFIGGITEPVGHVGNRLEADFHIITAKTQAVDNIKRCVLKAGHELGKSEFSLKHLILEPLASSMAVLSEDEMEAGVALVDIGGGTSDVAIFYDKIIRHTAVIPLGGKIITQDIKKGLSILNIEAEKLKVKYGSAVADVIRDNEYIAIQGINGRPPKEITKRNLALIIQSRVDEIIDFIYAEIINSGYSNMLGGGIVITGGGSMLANLKQRFEYRTGKDVRIGNPNEHLGKSKVDEVKSPVYATSVGLVLAGFRELDHRESKYSELSSKSKSGIITKYMGKVESTKNSKSFFRDILQKGKDLLIDKDFNSKNDY